MQLITSILGSVSMTGVPVMHLVSHNIAETIIKQQQAKKGGNLTKKNKIQY